MAVALEATTWPILGELGRAGMGVVSRVRHRSLNRIVAQKMKLAGGHAGNADLARFHAEAEFAKALHAPVLSPYARKTREPAR